jgi:DNA polymerase-4
MRAITRSATSPSPIDSTLTLTEIADHLVLTALGALPHDTRLTLLAISVSKLVTLPARQLQLPIDDLPDSTLDHDGSRWAVDRAVDAIRTRFGRASVGYASTALDARSSVPDEFRELAERE